jgi:hypothetical protein
MRKFIRQVVRAATVQRVQEVVQAKAELLAPNVRPSQSGFSNRP